MIKKKSTEVNNEKELNSKPSKIDFEYFAKWVATPRPFREIKSQKDLAKEYGIAEETLSRWKKRDGFWDIVSEEIRDWAKDKTPTVIQALYQGIIKDRKAPEIKLWLQYIEKWIEKQEQVHTGDPNINKQIADEINKLDEKIRKQIIAILRKSTKKGE